jgi:hypothetical protein
MTESTVDQVAKVINPYAFDEWQRHFVYAVGKGDTEEVAREFADWAGAGALATARRIAGPIAAEIDRLTAENERLREALTECAIWFQGYADGHTAKGDTDKAARNQHRADFARAALHPKGPEMVPGEGIEPPTIAV